MATLLLCQVCGAHVATAEPSLCPECRALPYCSRQHLALRVRCGHDSEECGRMQQQLARAAEVLSHTLAWPRPQTQEELHAWLQQLGCGTHSLLQACVVQQRHAAGEAAAPAVTGLPASQQGWEAAWALPGQQMAPAWAASEQLTACSGWADYYAARRMRPTSPAALALHAPLTLWHVLVQLMPSRGWQLPPPGATIRVAYLGPQVELHILPAFVELALLLPQHHLELHLVGPDVPDELHSRMCSVQLPAAGGQGGSLAISCWAGCFHDLMQDWQHGSSSSSSVQAGGGVACAQAAAAGAWRAAAPPRGRFDCVFAANAGLPVYPSWLPTLQRLASEAPASTCTSTSQQRDQQHGGAAATPVVFTDYCEEAAVKAQVLATQLLGRPFSLAPRLNPFRCPAPTHSHGTLLPACSNAFLFGWV